VRDDEIDKILNKAAEGSPSVGPELLNRISNGIAADLQPARPMASPLWLLLALIALCGVVGAAGASILGLFGLRAMSGMDAAIILPSVAGLILVAALVSVSESIPGSRRILSPAMLVTACCGVLAGVFALLYRDYTTASFVARGFPCLRAGLLHAIPAALGVWWILRRGWAVHPVGSAFARGALAGLAGVLMLELHCPNFETWHVIVWHTLVIPISGALACVPAWRATMGR
jgi:hypothetical protein